MEPDVHYLIHKSPPLVPILRHIIPLHDPQSTAWRLISLLSYHVRLGILSGPFPSVVPTKTLYASPLLHAC